MEGSNNKMQKFREKMSNLLIAKSLPNNINGISWCTFYDKYEIIPGSIIGEVRYLVYLYKQGSHSVVKKCKRK